MKKSVIMALALVAGSALGLSAQQVALPVSARNSVYVELLGNGLLYSVNYDRMLAPHISARVGFMGIGAASEEGSAGVMAAPVMVNYLAGAGNSRFEVGVGLMISAGGVENVEEFENESFSGAIGTATLGYRYQRPDGGFIFRVGLTPMFDTSGIAPWPGISFGYGF